MLDAFVFFVLDLLLMFSQFGVVDQGMSDGSVGVVRSVQQFQLDPGHEILAHFLRSFGPVFAEILQVTVQVLFQLGHVLRKSPQRSHANPVIRLVRHEQRRGHLLHLQQHSGPKSPDHLDHVIAHGAAAGYLLGRLLPQHAQHGLQVGEEVFVSDEMVDLGQVHLALEDVVDETLAPGLERAGLFGPFDLVLVVDENAHVFADPRLVERVHQRHHLLEAVEEPLRLAAPHVQLDAGVQDVVGPIQQRFVIEVADLGDGLGELVAVVAVFVGFVDVVRGERLLGFIFA